MHIICHDIFSLHTYFCIFLYYSSFPTILFNKSFCTKYTCIFEYDISYAWSHTATTFNLSKCPETQFLTLLMNVKNTLVLLGLHMGSSCVDGLFVVLFPLKLDIVNILRCFKAQEYEAIVINSNLDVLGCCSVKECSKYLSIKWKLNALKTKLFGLTKETDLD